MYQSTILYYLKKNKKYPALDYLIWLLPNYSALKSSDYCTKLNYLTTELLLKNPRLEILKGLSKKSLKSKPTALRKIRKTQAYCFSKFSKKKPHLKNL